MTFSHLHPVDARPCGVSSRAPFGHRSADRACRRPAAVAVLRCGRLRLELDPDAAACLGLALRDFDFDRAVYRRLLAAVGLDERDVPLCGEIRAAVACMGGTVTLFLDLAHGRRAVAVVDKLCQTLIRCPYILHRPEPPMLELRDVLVAALGRWTRDELRAARTGENRSNA